MPLGGWTVAELHLYDFDGTLFRAPDRPDWWGSKSWAVDSRSLGPPCVPTKPGPEWWIGSVVASAQKSISNPDVWAILCTGRALESSHRYRVPELLKQKGLSFDEVYLNPGTDTKSYKIETLRKLVERHDIDTVHIWENHLENMAAFCKAVEAMGRTCVQHPIRAAEMEPLCKVEPQPARVAARYLVAVSRSDCRFLSGLFVDPKGKRHKTTYSHAEFAEEYVAKTPAVRNTYLRSSYPPHENIDWGGEKNAQSVFLMEEGWIWVTSSNAFKVYETSGPSQAAWDSAVGFTIECVLAGHLDIEDTVYMEDNNAVTHRWPVGDFVERFASKRVAKKMWEGLLGPSRVAARYLAARSCPLHTESYGGLRGGIAIMPHTEYAIGASRILEAAHCLLGSLGWAATSRAKGKPLNLSIKAELAHAEEEYGIIRKMLAEYSRDIYTDMINDPTPGREEDAEATVVSLRKRVPKVKARALSKARAVDKNTPPVILDTALATYRVAIVLCDAVLRAIEPYPGSVTSPYADPKLQIAVRVLGMRVDKLSRAAQA